MFFFFLILTRICGTNKQTKNEIEKNWRCRVCLCVCVLNWMEKLFLFFFFTLDSGFRLSMCRCWLNVYFFSIKFLTFHNNNDDDDDGEFLARWTERTRNNISGHFQPNKIGLQMKWISVILWKQNIIHFKIGCN